MAKKSMKDAATSGLSVIDTIATGNTQSTESASSAQYAKGGNHSKYDGIPTCRMNLQLPIELKEWVQEAAYLESNAKHTVSMTEYICNLIAADKKKHKK
jgi:hypothetical protein